MHPSTWLAPTGSTLHPFEILDPLECETIDYPGVVIFARMGDTAGTVREATNLAADIGRLLTAVEARRGKQQIHWCRIDDAAARTALITELTAGKTVSPTRFK